MTPIKKKIIIFLSIAILILLILIGIRILSGENSWFCSENGWVKHGHPSGPMPTEKCGLDESGE